MSRSSRLIEIITSQDPAVRDLALDGFCRSASLAQLTQECQALDHFSRTVSSLYERVRACMFLYAAFRFHMPTKPDLGPGGSTPFRAYALLLERRFEEAIEVLWAVQRQQGLSDNLCSALATAYHQLAFKTLADQVRRSVRSVKGNQWMFRTGHPLDQPLRFHPSLIQPEPETGMYPVLHESTPVRMDLTHSGWSDIFFLGMDYPECARVINVSVDLGVHGRDPEPTPPVEAYLRVIDEPLIRLVSVDLKAQADVTSLAEVFDFAKDYLGLLKAALISAGIVPPGLEGSHQSLQDLLARMLGPGKGIELISHVRGIPKGSRLAVSTSLLAALITACMRATGQIASLTGKLLDHERRLVAARAILGEWLGGSGGGWQDSGGVWPGIKLISGQEAEPGTPEFGISRGRLLPDHHVFGFDEISPETRQRLQDSLILVHGGMAQNVGPILEMVTERYLLRSEKAWVARQEATGLLGSILANLESGDIPAIASDTTRNFFGPLETIIPWATNLYTETLIEHAQKHLGQRYLGFLMLGGMSGGGMGFFVEPGAKEEAQAFLAEEMLAVKEELAYALPFAMDPVVYDFAVNERGTWGEVLGGERGLLPADYYALIVPRLLGQDRFQLSDSRRAELGHLGQVCRQSPAYAGIVQAVLDTALPPSRETQASRTEIADLLTQFGFDQVQHEQIRQDLRAGRIGLAQNRLPISTEIRDVSASDILDATQTLPESLHKIGAAALREGRAAVVTLAGGLGSRWTQGAGVVKAISPFAKLGGRHRSFVEVHLAKSRRTGALFGHPVTHIVTTSYLTHEPISHTMQTRDNYGYPGRIVLSAGRAIGRRMIPMARDLRFAWEEMPQQLLDEQAQKVQDSLHGALIQWAMTVGEGSDYADNLPSQCVNPVGHWYEVPNMLLNGVLGQLLHDQPQLEYLMVHNVDTLGANLDPVVLGLLIKQNAPCAFEVIPRRIEDTGGGLAHVNGPVRLVEGLAMPREEDEFRLTYYNSNTHWLNIDALLGVFGLDRPSLGDTGRVRAAVRAMANRMPTYVTLKEVKKRWGNAQEDVYPVLQYEKLWGDMTALAEMGCVYMAVSRMRGQQLKEKYQLDGWYRDGSAEHVASICQWD